MSWQLPVTAHVAEKERAINTDYRDILDIIKRLNDEKKPMQTRLYVALSLFYENFAEISVNDRTEAVNEMMKFINCGEEEEKQAHPSPKRIDWEQDELAIVADINKASGCEVRVLPYLHWWTFVAYFNAIGEGQLSTLVSIRDKIRKREKLTDWEKEYYSENKSKVDFKRKYTAEELEEKERLIKRLKGL